LFSTVERWDLKVESVYVDPGAFWKLAGMEGVEPIGSFSRDSRFNQFRLWGARFKMKRCAGDRVWLVGNHRPGEPPALGNLQNFQLSWLGSLREGTRRYWDTFEAAWWIASA
jgi:hypothetical protein